MLVQLVSSKVISTRMKFVNSYRKAYRTVRRPFEKERLDQELKLCGEYGLRCKREIWRVQYMLSKVRKAARTLLMCDTKDPKRLFETPPLIRRLKRYGLLTEDENSLDDILKLTTQIFMERRLQTKVFKLNLAKSIHHARVLIRQRHIRVGKQPVGGQPNNNNNSTNKNNASLSSSSHGFCSFVRLLVTSFLALTAFPVATGSFLAEEVHAAAKSENHLGCGMKNHVFSINEERVFRVALLGVEKPMDRASTFDVLLRSIVPECSATLPAQLLRALNATMVEGRCRNKDIKINTVERAKEDMFDTVQASRSPGLLFPVLQSYERLMLNTSDCLPPMLSSLFSHLYVEVLPRMAGDLGSIAWTPRNASTVTLAYFNDQKTMHETTGKYHNDAHIANILYTKSAVSGKMNCFWADFGSTRSSALWEPYISMKTPLNKHFVMTTDGLLTSLSDAFPSDTTRTMLRLHNKWKLMASSEFEYFQQMLPAARLAAVQDIPENERADFFSDLHAGAGFGYDWIKEELYKQHQINREQAVVNNNLFAAIEQLKKELQDMKNASVVVNAEG